MAGEISEYKLITLKRSIRANSFKEAREKIRKSYKYEIVHIDITEVRPPWIMRMIKKLLKR